MARCCSTGGSRKAARPTAPSAASGPASHRAAGDCGRAWHGNAGDRVRKLERRDNGGAVADPCRGFAESLEVISEVPRVGFETMATVDTAAAWVAVQAIDAEGNTSAPARRSRSSGRFGYRDRSAKSSPPMIDDAENGYAWYLRIPFVNRDVVFKRMLPDVWLNFPAQLRKPTERVKGYMQHSIVNIGLFDPPRLDGVAKDFLDVETCIVGDDEFSTRCHLTPESPILLSRWPPAGFLLGVRLSRAGLRHVLTVRARARSTPWELAECHRRGPVVRER